MDDPVHLIEDRPECRQRLGIFAVEEGSDVTTQAIEHALDLIQRLQALAVRTSLERSGFLFVPLVLHATNEQVGPRDHLFPLGSGRLLVVLEKRFQLSRAQRLLPHPRDQAHGMLRVGARHRHQNSRGAPRRHVAAPNRCQDLG